MEQRHKFITHPNKCPSGPHQSRNLPSTCHEAIWFRIRRIWEDRGKEKRKLKMRCFFVGDAILSYTIQLYGDCFMNSCIDPYRPTRIAWKVRGCFFFVCVCVCGSNGKCITGLKQTFDVCLEPIWDFCGCENGCFRFDFPSQLPGWRVDPTHKPPWLWNTDSEIRYDSRAAPTNILNPSTVKTSGGIRLDV